MLHPEDDFVSVFFEKNREMTSSLPGDEKG